ncbi:di-heme-cytochrome C peroxidase [Nostoc sp. CALU 546]|uniref:di-heme-cytochrome C peroxidase n=1 Tax=Nostoc sp. CALU 546 TaxID=1867241 RepID=UPI003B67F165
MRKLMRIVLLVLAGVVMALAFTLASFSQDRPAKAKVVHLDQGWSQEDRLRYYYTSQGSAAMSYDIFLNLDAANNQGLFSANDNLAKYGFIPQPADSKYNPDGLPIGITNTVVADGRWKGKWVGLSCAACHNGQIEHKGTKISISGGNNATLDVHAFIEGLDDTLAATAADPQKFARLAEKLGQRDDAGKEALRKRLEEDAAAVHGYRGILAVTPTVVGPGRMDALRLIHNQVQSRWLDIPQNWVAPIAPVKPSFVWNIPQSAWAQWSGVLFDPILRNQGESLGVFARMDLTSKTPKLGLFDSTVDLKGQIASEALLRRLAPPQWPEGVLGKIDEEKAAKGAQLFTQNCAGCHSTWPHRWSEPKKQDKRFIENAIVSVDVIGTDPGQFSSPQFESNPTVKTGRMSEYLPAPDTGAAIAPPPVVFQAIQRGIFDKAVAKLKLSDEELVSAHGYRAFYPEPPDPIPAIGYKANPAEGMWASPPFLHNGSVPNLYELLLPDNERSKTFFIGREFDPVKVGVDTSGKSGKFLFDTSLVGNSNAGHSFENRPTEKGVIGRLLTEDERWALVEYMKSIPNQSRQIAPFGGPKDPIRAWQDKTFFHVKNPGTYNGAPQLSPASTTKHALAQESINPGEIVTQNLGLFAKRLVEKPRLLRTAFYHR